MNTIKENLVLELIFGNSWDLEYYDIEGKRYLNSMMLMDCYVLCTSIILRILETGIPYLMIRAVNQ